MIFYTNVNTYGRNQNINLIIFSKIIKFFLNWKNKNRDMKILIVDDDERSLKSLERNLRDEYVVDTAENGTHAEDLIYSNYYSLIILDLMLPDIDGEDLASVVKTRLPKIPIIAISGKRRAEDKDYALRKGCDDYVIKPISMKELRARMHALLRRYDVIDFFTKEKISVRDLVLDRQNKRVFYKEEKIELRKKEIQVLEFLMDNKNRLVTRSDIMENVWDSSSDNQPNTVDVHIRNIRSKIENPYNEKYIHTKHGMGFIFE